MLKQLLCASLLGLVTLNVNAGGVAAQETANSAQAIQTRQAGVEIPGLESTLDRLKDEHTKFLNSAHATYALTELGADAEVQEGSIAVKIGDKEYYYTPETADAGLLRTLSATGQSALEKTTSENALFTINGEYYTYNPERLPEASYTLTETSVEDPSAIPPNVIMLYEKRGVTKYYDPETGLEVAEGDRKPDVEYKVVETIETTPKYYELQVKEAALGGDTEGKTPLYFKWEEVDGVKKLVAGTADDHDLTYYLKKDYGETTAADKTAVYYKWQETDGNRTLVAGTETDHDIVYWKDQTKNYDRVTTDQGGADIDHGFAGLTSSDSGGAIYNSGEIGDITGDFIGNSAGDDGGAIVNYGEIGDITGGFIGNTAGQWGGAIYNSNGTIGAITGSFIGNNARSYGGAISNFDIITSITGSFIGNNAVFGGAISNASIITSITGDFIGNSASGDGGAIYNYGIIGDITGDFIGNSTKYGGAISNTSIGTIGNITGDFISNSASGSFSHGGAIRNNGDISSIVGNFVGNSASGEYNIGGAIYNWDGKIGNITGSFIGNTVNCLGGTYSILYGGAIGNAEGDNGYGTIGDIAGDFIGNSVKLYGEGSIGGNQNFGGAGGAIGNEEGIIDNITGNFIGNYVDVSGEINDSSNPYKAIGGAIGNLGGKIGDITADFIGNYAIAYSDSGKDIHYNAYGGAIANYRDNYSQAIIGDIIGDFIGNYASASGDKSSLYEAYGGAIYNSGTIGNITGNFIENYVDSRNGIYILYGGAIYNTAGIGDITGDFVGNYIKTTYGEYLGGGAIYNDGEIGNITGDFVSNYATATSGDGLQTFATGGAIYNEHGSIGDITGDFIGNSATATTGDSSGDTFASGGAIENYAKITSITGDFIGNYTRSDGMTAGGAIVNTGIIGKLNVSDISKILQVESYTIINSESREQQTLYEATDEDDIAYLKSAIEEGYKIEIIEVVKYVVSADEYKEMLSTAAEYGLTTENPVKDFPEDAFFKFTGGIINSSFINNYAEAKNGIAQGGAIATSTDLNLEANNGYTSVISGNYVEDKDGKRPEAIYVDSADATLGINANTDGKFIIDDTINGAAGYTVKFTGDETGYVQLNNNIEGGANIELNDLTLHLAARDDVLNGNAFTANSGVLNMINNRANAAEFTNVTIGGDTKILADVDLLNETMDRVTAPAYGSHSGNLHVVGMNLLTDAPADRDTTEIYFAETGLMNNVVNGTGELPDQYQTAYTPIYKYNVDYEVREDDGGYFLFTRGGLNSGNPSDNFNPAVLNTPVSNLAAGQATINETFKYVFEHADAFTQLPSMERMAQIKNDYYALSTDYNENLGVYGTGLAPEFHNDGAWVRPYVTFESMNLKNGPDVDAITYGTLIGFDSDFEDFGHGWTGVTTGYVGYNGSQLNYSGNDTSMNGGLLGVTQTFYKGDFWTAITASAGASVGETSTMYGSEDFTSLLAGIGSKTGYNFEFKEGKYILQPIMFLSYTFVNTFDYTNAAGVKIESDPLHTIQLNPSVRFIANLKNGWQPYASVGMVWNLLNQTDTTANGISLPDMHVKPYVEYGLGVQKRWADKFTAFFQTMIRNGGRNGVALTGGFRWSLGKDPDETVNNVNKVKKVIKTLDTKVAGK